MNDLKSLIFLAIILITLIIILYVRTEGFTERPLILTRTIYNNLDGVRNNYNMTVQ